MPTYVYRCNKGHTFELFHGISDETPKKCPTCRSGAKRVPAGGSGVLFKGSGFYQTDYRSPSYKEGAKQEKGGSASAPAPGGGAAPPPAGGGATGGSGGASSGPSGGQSGGSSSSRAPKSGD